MSNPITFRAMEDADQPMLRQWRNDPEVARHLYSGGAITPEEHAAWWERTKQDTASRYWIICLDGTPVGAVNLANIDPEEKTASWACYLADPAIRRRGIGLYVEFCLLAYAFSVLRLSALHCEALVSNEVACTLQESIGFERIVMLKDRCIKDGVPQNAIAYRMASVAWSTEHRPRLENRLRRKGIEPVAALPPLGKDVL